MVLLRCLSAAAGKKRVAGCSVLSGKLLKGASVTVKRGKTIVYEGKVGRSRVRVP